MGERRQDLRLTLKPGQSIGIGGERIRENLQRDLTFQPGVGGAIHLPLPPSPICAVMS
jgi:hypothetical protein